MSITPEERQSLLIIKQGLINLNETFKETMKQRHAVSGVIIPSHAERGTTVYEELVRTEARLHTMLDHINLCLKS